MTPVSSARALAEAAQAVSDLASLKVYVEALRRENGRRRRDNVELQAALDQAHAELRSLRRERASA